MRDQKSFALHEPDEPLLSVEDAYADAEQSEERWQAFEESHGLKRVLVDLPEPIFRALQRVAERQNQTVARLVGQVMTDLADAFEPWYS
ncbi:MAG: hypothetical protein JXA14_10110 [Anaerolineae bacterium]|nr:hypothetical protein [Anaerolineae bacterium]